MHRGNRAFTLIELMIAIAILAIIIAVPKGALHGLNRLAREDNYRHALANARYQLEQMRQEDYDSLPPQLLTVDANGQVKVSRKFLNADSVKVYREGQPVEARVVAPGIYQVDAGLKGQKVVVNYSFALPDKGEALVVDERGEVELHNRPVVEVVAVHRAAGDKLTKLDGFKLLDRDSGRLQVGAQHAGQVVLVDYLGESVRNHLESSFLDAELLPTNKPGEAKLLKVVEQYGGVLCMKLELVRSKP